MASLMVGNTMDEVEFQSLLFWMMLRGLQALGGRESRVAGGFVAGPSVCRTLRKCCPIAFWARE